MTADAASRAAVLDPARDGDQRPRPELRTEGAWQCGLLDEEAAQRADGRCRDLLPELILELL